MSHVTLKELFEHPKINKYLNRSGLDHAINVAQYAYKLALEKDVDPDLATKAGLLHDIGHYNWYHNGEWDFNAYKQNDIHTIKGASRAHEYLLELGEARERAKEIALAVLLHTDSYLPQKLVQRTPLQEVIAEADLLDEEPLGRHHYRKISFEKAIHQLSILDQKVIHMYHKQQGLA